MAEKVSPTILDTETMPIDAIEISETGRYVVVLSFARPLRGQQEADLMRRHIGEQLADWWKSGRKFLVLLADSGVEVKFKRVAEEEDDGGDG